jgi:hypothetical protein
MYARKQTLLLCVLYDVNHTVHSLTLFVLYETFYVQVSKLITLHEEGEDGKSDLVTHTMYSFNPFLYSMNPVM